MPTIDCMNHEVTGPHDAAEPTTLMLPVMMIGFITCLGGDAVQMMELATGMQTQGRAVHIIVPDMPAAHAFANRCRERGLSIECSPLIAGEQTGSRQSLLKLLRLFRSMRGNIVHIHTGDLVLPRMAMLALQLTRLPAVYVTVHHSTEYLEPRSSRARAWAVTVQRYITKVICPSEHSVGMQVRLGVPPARLLLIRNGVDMSRYGTGNGDKVRTTSLSHLPTDAQLALFTARMVPGKEPGDVLEAFQRIAHDVPKAHLVFVGYGDLEPEVRAAVLPSLSDRVHFVGYQTNIPDWLAASTVWVHASQVENCSMALIEAMAAGCPIAATMCQGNNEVLIEGKNALTYAPKDIEALAGILQKLLSDAELRTNLSMQARQTADRFSLRAMLTDHLELYYATATASPAVKHSEFDIAALL